MNPLALRGRESGAWLIRGWVAALSPFLAAAPSDLMAQADTAAARRDSLRVHELSEVVVRGVHATPAPLPYTAVVVEPRSIRQLDAISVAEVTRVVPATHIQTNSRGETLVYLRNAGERQVAAFLDGALLNVPWDNRVDLSLVPAPMIAGVQVVQGVPPVEYGANVLGGAVNLTSPTWTDLARRGELSAQLGTEGQIQGTVAYRGSSGGLLYALAASHASRDGLPLPRDANLLFNQPDPDLRTNTDSRITSGSVRLAYLFSGGTEVGLSLLHVDAEKGVAPEGHKDPSVSRVRFWRYPDWRNTMGILSARGMLGNATLWKGAAWVNRFEQNIDSYTSASYDSLESREEDDDLTIGGRVVAQRDFGASALKLAVNALTSTHKQRDLELEPDGSPLAGREFPRLTYRQIVLSGGLEYEIDPVDNLDITIGASIDAMLAPETGDKPPIDPFVDYSVTAGFGYRISGGWHLRAGAGRKTRFPTMRELFGEALNRFLINPDLQPESSVLVELGVGLRTSPLRLEAVPFASFTSNTIDQRSVLVSGETRPRRQRINLKGSRVLGVQLSAEAAINGHISAAGHLTLSHVRRLQDQPTDPVRLSEKPEALGRLGVSYLPATGPTLELEAVYTGRAYSLDDNNEFVPLPTSLVFNARAGYRFSLPGERSLELFARMDNVTDELVVPQLGLPGPGRSAQGGIKLAL
ncbi:Vitamin B12 transporter BtuB [bacterium HR33]|nr:Vitamin B12 transporter BtuB [bacterium HR33]